MNADLLCYIMDYSDHYYRLNQADHLVVAAGKEEAAVFTFAQAERRICTGRKSSFYRMVPIEAEVQDEKLCEIPKTCVTPEPEKDAATGRAELEICEDVSAVKALTCGELQEVTEKKVFSYDLSEMDWEEYLTHFSYVASGISGYRETLTKKLSDMEQKICDILHYIELCETDEEEAADLIELLRVCREKRREVKDELMRTEYFQSQLGTSSNAAKAKQALKSMQGLKTRKYRPRKYDELFENCTMKKRKEEKAKKEEKENKKDKDTADMKDTPNAEDTLNRKDEMLHIDDTAEAGDMEAGFSGEIIRRSALRTVQERDGGERMAEEKIYTPYDGKENDWQAFARQQAEFYRYAGQYMTNLQIAIQEIAQEIEDILQETEDANYNVAQGYKVFKRLKELRLERKAKTQELDCLYALTDYMDCDALAGVCEDNLAEIEQILHVENETMESDTQTDETVSEQIYVFEPMQDKVS